MASVQSKEISRTVMQSSTPGAATPISRWWRLVGALLMTLALGTLYAWSVFVAPLENEFGWKRAQTSNVFTIAVVTFATSLLIAGRLQDRFGPFWFSITGGALVSLGFFLCAYTSSLRFLFLCYGVLGGIGNGFGFATVAPVMAKWFPDKRGLAIGLALAGSFLLRNPPEGYRRNESTPAPASRVASSNYEFTPSEILRTPAFYLMWLGFGLGSSAGLLIISPLVPFARRQGIPGVALATMTLAVGAIGNVSGRILSGWLSDALGRLNTLRVVLAI